MGCSASRQVIVQSSKKCLESHNNNKADTTTVAADCSLLNQEEKHLIRLTWKPMQEDLASVGKQVFLKIFETQPSVKQMFPFRHVWGDSLIKHPQFKAHVSRFMLTVGEAVNNMDDLTHFGDSLYVLGKGHTQHRGFFSNYFDAFLTSMMFVWQQELKMNSETREAWQKLLGFIMDKLKEGYVEQLKLNVQTNKKAQTNDGDIVVHCEHS